ncbi:hypothetical protein [Flavobacterium sp. C4GT6]|uniref:hypothetical protein n=1 Tax=Flavobacterium sp. C4GT6 TaxID=3103818 RepID=UPI002ECFC323
MRNFHFLLVTALLFLTSSCSVDDGAGPENPAQEPVLYEHPMPKDITITSADGSIKSMHFEYADTNSYSGKITKITYEDGSYDDFIYNYDIGLVELNRVKNGETIEYTQFEYDSSNLLKKRRYVLREDDEPLMYVTTFSHNTSTKTHMRQQSENDPFFEEQSISFQTYFNHFVFVENLNNNTSSSFEYTTETYSPYVFVTNRENLLWIFFYITDRNCTMERKYIDGVNAGQDRYDYIYNEEKFPVEVKKYNNASNELLETTTYSYYNL